MPRLEGRRSSPGLTILLLAVIVILLLLVLEFLGTIDLIATLGVI